MEASHNRKCITARVIRPGDSVLEDEAPDLTTMEERIDAVWELPLLCLAWREIKQVNRDFRDLLAEFNAGKVDHIVVNAETRATQGLLS